MSNVDDILSTLSFKMPEGALFNDAAQKRLNDMAAEPKFLGGNGMQDSAIDRQNFDNVLIERIPMPTMDFVNGRTVPGYTYRAVNNRDYKVIVCMKFRGTNSRVVKGERSTQIDATSIEVAVPPAGSDYILTASPENSDMPNFNFESNIQVRPAGSIQNEWISNLSGVKVITRLEYLNDKPRFVFLANNETHSAVLVTATPKGDITNSSAVLPLQMTIGANETKEVGWVESTTNVNTDWKWMPTQNGSFSSQPQRASILPLKPGALMMPEVVGTEQ